MAPVHNRNENTEKRVRPKNDGKSTVYVNHFFTFPQEELDYYCYNQNWNCFHITWSSDMFGEGNE